MWPRLMANKWFGLRPKPGGDKFNSDMSETDDEPEPLEKSPRLRRGQSETLWTQCVDNYSYRIFVGTWNVGGKTPEETLDLDEWLNTKESSDIYVIGFQEIVPLKAGKVFGAENSRSADKWDTQIRKALNKNGAAAENASILRSATVPTSAEGEILLDSGHCTNNLDGIDMLKLDDINKWRQKRRYIRIASKQMVGIFITIWVKSEVRCHIRDLKVSSVGCGIMGCLGNKGSVSISMSLHETSFCFVCTHLASGEKESDGIRRNSDVAEILKRTCFPRDSTLDLPQTILGHDRIIWFGDLNYRLTIAESEAKSLIHQKDWNTLQLTDQLKLEKNPGGLFDGWQEGHIDFSPTYKYVANSDEYCGTQEKRRVPA
ncbi:hypothetical protein KI387_001699, partial [Taxus chinensis]